MNLNTQTILNHIRGHLGVVGTIEREDTDAWNNLDADIHLDVADGILDAQLIGDDIDAAFDEVCA